MSRFYIPPENIHRNSFALTGSEAWHAAKVLRMEAGDTIDLFDGKNLSYQGRIENISADRVDGVILSEAVAAAASSSSKINLILYQALIKGPKWDWLVEKACEVGVTTLVPVVSARTIVRPTREDVTERWKRIALAAGKQCGRVDVMGVSSVTVFSEAVNNIPKGTLALIPWEKEQNRSIRTAKLSSPAVTGRGSMGSPPVTAGYDVVIFIGPEGGWELDEVERAQKKGIVPVRLGPTLLRSETAGLVAATLVLSEFGVYS